MLNNKFLLNIKYNILIIILIFISNIIYSNNNHINNINLDNITIKNIEQIPVLHNGRVKPIDSLARITLKQIANKESINNQSASSWFINLLINPHKDYDNKIFYINNIELIQKLNLPTNYNSNKKPYLYYSFKQIIPSIKKNIDLITKLEKNQQSLTENPDNKNTKDNTNYKLSKLDKDLLDLYYKLLLYFDYSRSLSLFLSIINNNILVQNFDLKINNNIYNKLSYYQLLDYQDIINNKINNALQISQNNLANKTRDTSDSINNILSTAKILKDTYSDKINNSLKIIYYNNQWLSPWEAAEQIEYRENKNNKQLKYILDLWQNFIINNSHEALTQYSINNYYKNNIENKINNNLITEIKYNKYKYFNKALFGYFITLILSFILLFCLNKKYIYQNNKLNLFYIINFCIYILSTILAGVGLISRILILQRPPVANLYESILFVSFIAAILAIIIELYINKKNQTNIIGILTGSVICFFLLLIANSYADIDDNLGVLIAVLNNNFWLGTHVITITAGYGSCLILSAISHINLIKLNFSKNNDDLLNKYILAFCLLSLFLTMFGTILGGIWADQSWGRFWGWDPKENGAMLICLWLIAILHGKISKKLNTIAFTSLSALTSITVAIAWFGVNLLNTGLHSYGFTENIANNLILFIIFELAFILGLWFNYYRYNNNNKINKTHGI